MDFKHNSWNQNEEILQDFCRSALKSKIFIGTFKEKRFVEELKNYRDVIEIQAEENEIIEDLTNANNELIKFYYTKLVDKEFFIGFAKNDKIYSLWTELHKSALNEDQTFGKYWFQIRSIKFRDNEFQCKLKVLRPVDESDHTKSIVDKLALIKALGEESAASGASNDEIFIQWKGLFEMWKREFSEAMVWFLGASLNRQNIKEGFRLLFLLLVSLLVGVVHSIKFIGIFTIKFMHQLGWLIHVSTPILMGILDLVSKVIGGIYILIAMIWKDSIGAPQRQLNNALNNGNKKPKAIQYNRKSVNHSFD